MARTIDLGLVHIVPKHGVALNSDNKEEGLDYYHPTDHDPVFAREESTDSSDCLPN